jgi:hypothetical protein
LEQQVIKKEPQARKLLIDVDEVGIALNVSLNYHFRNKYEGNRKPIVDMTDFTAAEIPPHLETFLGEECNQLIPDVYVSKDLLYSLKAHYEGEVGLLRRGTVSRSELIADKNSSVALDFDDVWSANGIVPKHGSYCMSFFPTEQDFLKFMQTKGFTDLATASPLLAQYALKADNLLRVFYMVKQSNYGWLHSKITKATNGGMNEAKELFKRIYPVSDIFHLYQVCVALQNEE